MTDLTQKLQTTLKHAYTHAPAIRQRFDEANLTPDDIQTVADLAKLPVFSKDQMVEAQKNNPPFGGFLAVPQEEVSHIFFSPGPLYEPGPTLDDSVWDVAVEWLRKVGFTAGEVILNSLSYHLVPAGYLFDVAFTRLGATVIPAGTGHSDLQLKMMLDLGATGYVGTPSFLMSLIRKVEEQGLDFRQVSKLTKAVTTAEPLPPSLRQTLAEYGIQVINAYGTAELGIIAINTEGMVMQLLPEPIIEVVNPETGQPVGAGEAGEVVVTNFSHQYPLIRFGTGDMAVNVDPNPETSTQSERGIILVGRSGDAVKVRGMFVHPNQLGFAARQVGVEAMSIIITRPDLKDVITIEAVTSPESVEPLKQAIQAACRLRVDEVVVIEKLTEGTPLIQDKREWA